MPYRSLLGACLALWAVLPATAEEMRIAIASTLDSSGLAQALAASFAQDENCQPIMVTTASAHGLALLANGDVAAAVTHAPQREREFVNAGPGRTRHEFGASEFVLAGPPSDPAGIRDASLATALQRIMRKQAAFISRADGSGTHEAELELWQATQGSIPGPESWYREAGGHMGATLWLAAETGAYTLSDTATLASLQQQGLALEALARDTPPRDNVYSVMLPAVPSACARRLANWLGMVPGRALLTRHAVGNSHPFRPLP